LKGTLFYYDAHETRIVLGDLVLSIATEDIVDINEIASPEISDCTYGIPVELKLRVNCRLRGVAPSWIYKETIINGKKPFALSCRPEILLGQPSIRYHELEKEFLELNDIKIARHDSHNLRQK
jgi:hypothetical protein